MTRRLLMIGPTVAAIIVISFLLIHAAPGDPLLSLAGEHGDAAYYSFMRQRFGLDAPLTRQFVTYAMHVLRGDFGVSYVQGRAAMPLVLERIPATLLLTFTSLLVTVVISIPLGMWAACRQGAPVETVVRYGALALYSTPVFCIGQLLIIVIAFKLHWLPVEGIRSASINSRDSGVVDLVRHLALPVIALSTHEVAALTQLVRNGISEELTRDYVRTARAQGLTERVVLFRHALPRVLLSIVSVVGSRMGQLLAGAVVVEIVFGWPGMGRLLLAALQNRDAPVLLAIFFVISCSVVVTNLITDLLYAAIDPRIRYS